MNKLASPYTASKPLPASNFPPCLHAWDLHQKSEHLRGAAVPVLLEAIVAKRLRRIDFVAGNMPYFAVIVK
ncbi:MAG TPA: hypothetical protein PLI09_05030 [Candidatus Hydrogenedentes bacterium]|nr:hypothetical protein [Candidatus Hydrogenedentota bacterium]